MPKTIRCLMLVEGPYDRQRLSVLINLFDNSKLVLVPYGTDAFTSKDYYLEYKDKISNVLSKEKTNELSDFNEIVHVCDTDGCFIDDSFVIEDKTIKHIIYESNCIKVVDRPSVVQHRINKRNNIDKILKENIFKIYYNSTNIDHAYDNTQNPSDIQKKQKAIKMYDTYKNDCCAFLERLVKLCPTIVGYAESWGYIRKDFNSLKPCTNILFFILAHHECLKDEYKNKLLDLLNKKE